MLTLSETNFQSVLACLYQQHMHHDQDVKKYYYFRAFSLVFHQFRIELLSSAKHFISCEISCDDKCFVCLL
jgi:hypothetical protein